MSYSHESAIAEQSAPLRADGQKTAEFLELRAMFIRCMAEIQDLRQLTIDGQNLAKSLEQRMAGTFKEFYTTEEVAALRRVTPGTVRRWHRKGILVAERGPGGGPKGRLLISRAALQELVAKGYGGELSEVVVPAQVT
jgi:hypothetical protein